jgi:hypothetical protein
MFRTTVLCLGGCVWGAGCGEWPRFAHLPVPQGTPYGSIRVTGTLDEGGVDWPAEPAGLPEPAADGPAFGEPLYAVDIHGTADGVAHLVGGGVPFTQCPDLVDQPPMEGHYQGDVDVVRIKYADPANAAQYGLCLVLQTSVSQDLAMWDLIAWEYSEADQCAVGPFLTLHAEGDESLAAYIPVDGHNYVTPGHPDLALSIAGSQGTDTYTDSGDPIAVDYDVFVYPVRDPVGCEALTPDFFQSEPQ